MNGFLVRNRAVLLAYGAVVLLLLVTAAFSPGFLSAANIRATLVLAAFVGIVALGQTFVIIGAGIDLSIPWVLNTAAILMTMLCASENLPLLWVMPLMLALGGGIGLFNGVGVAYFGVPAIIMTLATNVMLQGLILVFTGGSPTPLAPDAIRFLAVGQLGQVPVIVVIWAVLGVAATVLLSKMSFGRHLYALGGNETVAEFSGVPTRRTKILTYVGSGMTAAFAGMLMTGYSGQAYLGMGDPYLFTSVAAAAIGGASILGGTGHYVGTVAGALVLTILTGLLPALNLSSGALQVVYGAVILITVALSSDGVSATWAALFGRRKTQGAK
ncbi:ABC transporter permease [Oricola indica]|jgi:ribose transport system permease protein|uniref:ABC transporter permease n=1 Tax=Oricola indica TaxID=2872591 RepID=UPI001CBACB1F|nr:ABC transporter permease [Oricola indica]